ncbi:MAG TPA: heme lyase CcmF/NrfE family subunit [Candidatus Marinimicrobia bacterium]|nr:heme lyase CcmF/NrfE family subunit [Candidatus Neomarinimicrobiota bacterium]
MIQIGTLTMQTAFALVGMGLLLEILGIWQRRNDLITIGIRTIYALFFLLTVSNIALVFELMRDNFRLEYIASYSSKATPPLYKFTALWGGQAGSLLFWSWVLAAFSASALWIARKRDNTLVPYAAAIFAFVLLFFTLMINFYTNPFELLPPDIIVPDGRGLNPLLQNIGMAIHPPLLYIGYIGFVVPFAFAMAALFTGRLDNLWLNSTRNWTLLSWLFLTLGIVVGMIWAYVELGWGGYWGWDPVENASLIPWLTATAYIHSVIIQQKKDMFKIWNLLLVIITFLLTILGTFITRSGLISSVHAFGESEIGYLFLKFMALITIVSLAFFFINLKKLRSTRHLESPLSRESSFLLNNIILLAMAFAVLYGTLLPTFTELIHSAKITVGPPFFNKINIPIGLALLALMAYAPLFAWRRISVNGFLKKALIPTAISLVLLIVLLIFTKVPFYAALTYALSLLTFAVVFVEIGKGVHVWMGQGLSWTSALFTLVGRNRRRYGAFLVHIGVVLMYIGFSGAVWNEEIEGAVKKGESMAINDYRITFIEPMVFNRADHNVKSGRFLVEKDGKAIGTLIPEKRFYAKRNQYNSDVSVITRLSRDIYLVLADLRGDTASVKILINPLVLWIWIGSGLMTIGTVIAIWPRRHKKGKE